MIIITALTFILTGLINTSYPASAPDQPSKQAALVNAALKKQFELGPPDTARITSLLSAKNYSDLERIYDGYLHRYEKDAQYEWMLQQAYEIFSPDNSVALEDINDWVANSGSYAAYGARGTYKAKQGFNARGRKFIDQTQPEQIESMQRFHDDAAKDLQTALDKMPSCMPLYITLIDMARASSMPFTIKDILDRAEAVDKRTYLVRTEYMFSLQPKWGGSFDAMAEFAQHALQYLDRNPRLWSLQGDVHAARAVDFFVHGKYESAAAAYTDALSFGDRISWLKGRSGVFTKMDKEDAAIADQKKILYYDPTDAAAKKYSQPWTHPLDVKYDLSDKTSVDPHINDLHIKSYAVLSVQHQIGWLNNRPDKGAWLPNYNIRKIERMLGNLGCEYVTQFQIARIFGDHNPPRKDITPEKIRQLGADAVVMATIVDMGLSRSLNQYYEVIDIQAISVKTGQPVWRSVINGSTSASPVPSNYLTVLDSIESKLYEHLQSKLRESLPPVM